MNRRPVHHAVYDTLADWETGHTTAWLARAGYEIRTVGPSPALHQTTQRPSTRSW